MSEVLTGAETKKAIECCTKWHRDCLKCPSYIGKGPTECENRVKKGALDLINRYEAKIAVLTEENNRQKAEIDNFHSDTIPKLQAALVRANKYGLQADEANKIFKEEIKRLQNLANYHRNLINELNKGIAEAKAEAVEGFAEIVKANLDDFYYTGEDGLLETGDLIDTLVNQELRALNNATKKLPVGTVEKTRALFQAMVNKFMSVKDLYVIVDGEYLPWEPSEEIEHLFGMSISGDNDEIDKETDRVVKELVGDDNG